jgi:translation initiation factor 2D
LLIEVDEILKKSLYQALLFKIKPDTSNGVFPISASSFYSAHILPCRPKNSGPEVDIKKSSWKKLQKFLKTMEKAGLLKTKDQRGETMVTSINWSHPR